RVSSVLSCSVCLLAIPSPSPLIPSCRLMLCQCRPVLATQQPTPHPRPDVAQLEGFGQVIGGASRKPGSDVRLLRARGQEHHWHLTQLQVGLSTYGAADLQARASGHHPIQENEGRPL